MIVWTNTISTALTGKLTTEHPYKKSYLFPSTNPRFGCLQSRKGINNLLVPSSLFRLCSYISLYSNISNSRFYICTACFTQTSQLPHWLAPELEMRLANESAALRIYINNFTQYFAPAQRPFTEHTGLCAVVVPATMLRCLITIYDF